MRIMFGKYCGREIAAIPLAYLNWLLENIKDQPMLRKEARLVLCRKKTAISRYRQLLLRFGNHRTREEVERIWRKTEILML
jgi:hypothetical protein